METENKVIQKIKRDIELHEEEASGVFKSLSGRARELFHVVRDVADGYADAYQASYSVEKLAKEIAADARSHREEADWAEYLQNLLH